MSSTDPDHTKSESDSNICDKSNRDISVGVDSEELWLDDSKDLINNYNTGKVCDEMTWREKILPTDLDCIKSKSHDDICDKSNHNISDEVSDEEIRSNNLEDLDSLCNTKSIWSYILYGA